MEEDGITLYFNLATSINFRVGDYIDDEVFGRFTISDDPLPADYDPDSGAYKYELRFDADWICWKNHIFMLTYGEGTVASPYVRRETEWVLTDTLDSHAAVIRQNLVALGYAGYSVNVHAADVPSHLEVICITYSGTSILDAIKTLCNSYSCEFWMDGKVLHFGKCETGTAITLSMTSNINVENMVPTRNDNQYGNRFFAYGSTKNIPETYRKHLEFVIDRWNTASHRYITFKDTTREIDRTMMVRSVVKAETTSQRTYAGTWKEFSHTEVEDSDEFGTWKVITTVMTSEVIPVVEGWTVDLQKPTLQGDYAYTFFIYSKDGTLLTSSISNISGYQIGSGIDGIIVRYSYEMATHLVMPTPDSPTLTWEVNTEAVYLATLTAEGGQTSLVALMDGNWFAFVTNTPGASTAPQYATTSPISGFGLNSKFLLSFSENDSNGLVYYAVPTSYYTADEDELDSVRLLGERRLMLPRPPYSDSDLQAVEDYIENGYVQRDLSLTEDQIVEKVVLFENVYPRCALRVTEITEGQYENDTTYSDGSTKSATLPAYILQAKRIAGSSDVDFPFDPYTMIGFGQKLTATFLTPDETKKYSGNSEENACLLMGMTFDVYCTRSNGITTYQLAWNSDYGDKLPNEVLKPKPGDAFILAGWNPAAMSALGLIASAEKELALVSDEYARLMEEAQFTFDCTMMSDWVETRMASITPSSGQLPFVKLFLPGQKVVVNHGALRTDKETRVIGFEYKLDIPYDSPILIVGETDKYNRLKEIEKSLNAQTKSTVNSGSSTQTTAASASSMGGKGAKEPLHIIPGSMDGAVPTDYDGTAEKTVSIPSTIDHLVDSDKLPRIAISDGQKILVDKDGNDIGIGGYFELVQDTQDPTKYSVKLKDQYLGLWAPGWLVAGGIGTPGGGGGSVSYLNDLSDVTAPNPSNGDLLVYNSTSGAWVNVPQSQIVPSIGFSDLTSHPTDLSGYGITDAYTKTEVDGLLANIDLSDYVTNEDLAGALETVNVLADITTPQNGTVVFTWANGDVVNVDLNHQHSNYVPITRQINGHSLNADVTLSAVTDLGVAPWAMGTGSTIPFGRLPAMYIGKTRVKDTNTSNDTLIGISGFTTAASPTESGDTSLVEWVVNDGVGSWHFKGNLYVDGWFAAGGVGSGGGSSLVFMDNIQDVDIDETSLANGDILRWNSSTENWENQPLNVSIAPAGYQTLGGITVSSTPVSSTPTLQTISTTSDRYYAVQVDSDGLAFVNVPWSGGSGSSASWGTYSSTAHTIELTVNGTSYVLCENGYSAGGGVSSESDPVFTASPAYGITAADITAWRAIDDYALKTGDSSYNFLVNTLKFSVGKFATNNSPLNPRPRWVYTDGTSLTPTTITKDLAYKDEIPTSLKCPNKLNFKNGDTTTIQYDGSVTRNVTASDIGAVTITGTETISGAKTFTADITLTGADIMPSTNGTCDLGGSSARFANLYAVNANLSGDLAVGGDLSVASGHHIDLGPVRLEFANNALHVTTNDATNYPTIGLYADGFVSSGGVGSSSQYIRYVYCTLSEYNALATKDEATMYFIGDPVSRIYLGTITIYSEA